MHADLVKLGFDGSYERVATFMRGWKVCRQLAQQTTGRGAFVPLVLQSGEAFRFDWSEDWAIFGGERVKLQVAHIKLSRCLMLIGMPSVCLAAFWAAAYTIAGIVRH